MAVSDASLSALASVLDRWAVALLVGLPAVIFLYKFSTRNFDVFKKLGVPGPKAYPLIGSAGLLMSKGLFKHDLEMKKLYGPIVGTFQGRVPVMIIYDVDILKQILVKEFSNFQNRLSPDVTEYPLTKMLTVLKGDHWRHVRSVMAPTFSSGKLRRMNEKINKCAESLLKTLEDKAEKDEKFEFKQICGAFTMDAIASTGFGVQINCHTDPNNPFVKNAKEFFDFKLTQPRTIVLFFFPFLIRPLSKLGFAMFAKESTNFFISAIDKAFDERKQEEKTSKSTDFLQLLLNADVGEAEKDVEKRQEEEVEGRPNWSEKVLTHEEVLAQSIMFFLTAYETTANTLAFFGYSLAVNPECQNKLITEIDNVVNCEDEVTYDIIQKMPYLDMCLSEVLRLYPAGPRADRVTINDITINGVFIPKGMCVGIPIYALQMDPEIWPEPEKFIPERFTSEEKEVRNPYHYMPFGMGPRNCIGMRLAVTELKMVMVRILLKFRFVACKETDIPLTFDKIAMKSVNGITIKVERR